MDLRITVNPLEHRDTKHLLEFYRTTDKKCIDTRTVRSIASKKRLDAKILRGERVFATEEVGIPYAPQYEDTLVYLITFEYKNRWGSDSFYVAQEEYERLRDYLQLIEWYI